MNPEESNQPEPFPRDSTPPEIVEWARQTLNETDFVANIREVEAKGGFELKDFLAEVEARARSK
jgi:hypothetical protein